MDELLKKLAQKHDVAERLIRRLIAYEQSRVHLRKRSGVKNELRRIIEKHLEEHEQ